MNDKILLSGIRLDCHLGVSIEERVTAQGILVDLDLMVDVSRAGKSDRFADTIDYAAVRDVVARVAARRPYALVESLAESMAEAILAGFAVEAVRVLLRKPRALTSDRVDWAGVEIVRTRHG